MTPVQIFEDEATEERAENARLVRVRANGEGGKRKGTDMTAFLSGWAAGRGASRSSSARSPLATSSRARWGPRAWYATAHEKHMQTMTSAWVATHVLNGDAGHKKLPGQNPPVVRAGRGKRHGRDQRRCDHSAVHPAGQPGGKDPRWCVPPRSRFTLLYLFPFCSPFSARSRSPRASGRSPRASLSLLLALRPLSPFLPSSCLLSPSPSTLHV